MNKIYLEIWRLAKPYYEKGRPWDVKHVEWMMKQAEKLAVMEGLDKRLLLPIVILHDVGYSAIREKSVSFNNKSQKIAHMAAGAKIAREILEKVGYDKNLTEKIVYFISVHDNWLLGDDTPFKTCKEMAAFNDLDFLWVNSSFDVFRTSAKAMKMTLKQFHAFWSKDEKLVRRPFCCEYTKKMFEETMKEYEKRIDGEASSGR